jgi:NADPH-dependent 2,4-dienoyl-CoA reductase/sulfur reductase-like enzyme/nitrite reductase/ring-hydroxylating ferredoxin subunit
MPECDVGSTNSVAASTLKAVTAGKHELLLANVDGTIHALGGKCPHYGAPLAEGCLIGDRLYCPWHQGCFAASTGALLEPPPLDALPHFPVRHVDGRLIVTVPEDVTDRRDAITAASKSSAPMNDDSPAHIAIVGAGAAGIAAAQRLRELGFPNKITIISDDPNNPYDRPACSKALLTGEIGFADEPFLHPAEFYTTHHIDRLHDRVTAIDAATRTINFEHHPPFIAERILIATGSRARRANLPGDHLSSVFYLRTLADADRLVRRITQSTARRAVVVGGSFIAMEAAAALVQRGLEVTVILSNNVPFEKTLGPEIGGAIQSLHEKHGVRFITSSKVTQIAGETDVRQIRCDTGETVDAELNTETVRNLTLSEDHSIPVDATLATRSPGIFAAGDVARIAHPHFGESLRIEHWRFAEQQGRAAAENMLGQAQPFRATPYFWTFQFDFGLDMLGHAEGWDAIHWEGHPTDAEFLAYYLRNDKIIAVAGRNQTRAISVLLHLFDAGQVPPIATIRKLGSARLAELIT